IGNYHRRFMAGEVYRFLLRMPQHLREQLASAAARSGRSLNGELVHRLERSLAYDSASRWRRLRIRLGESSMRRRVVWRWSLAAGVLAAAMAAVFAAFVMNGSTPAAAPVQVEGGMSPGLAAHVADLKRAIPPN